jgi:two-component system chemotaxis response regulator CheY
MGENQMKKVLIVDDAAFMRIALRSMLEKNRFEVVGEAENGAVGVKKYINLQPDIVTMDITMPEMDGIEALKQVREVDPNSKVVMVSAMGQEKYVRDSVILGAKSFIVKPFNEDHVVKTLSQVLEI